jgi:hypothetical protein
MLAIKGMTASMASQETEIRLPQCTQDVDSAGPRNDFLACDIAGLWQ